MKLGNRLNAVFNEIDDCKIVADIGTDHGLIACKCMLENKCQKVIATDISDKSLDKAKQMAKRLNLNKIEFKVGDGLQVLDEEVCIVVIAGMGGLEIIKIMSHENIKNLSNSKFVLSPMQHPMKLRTWLVNNNFNFINEKIVKEKNKFYFIFKVQMNENYCGNSMFENCNADIEIAKAQNDFIAFEYLKAQLIKIENILKNMENANNNQFEVLENRKNIIVNILQNLNKK